MNLDFPYFRAPPDEMIDLTPSPVQCHYCRAYARCFQLKDSGADGVGCPDCLRDGRFGFLHDTEIGLILSDGSLLKNSRETKAVFLVASDGVAHAGDTLTVSDEVPQGQVRDLWRTPRFREWNGVPWPRHCGDFMAFVGIWTPAAFEALAGQGRGRAAFLDCAEPNWHFLWPAGTIGPPAVDALLPTFECRGCGHRITRVDAT